MSIGHELRGAEIKIGVVFFVFGRISALPSWRDRLLRRVGLLLCAFAASAHAQPFEMAYDDDGVITVNGERRFILGAYAYSTDPEENADAIMGELADAGFNLVYVRGKFAQIPATAAAANGLMTWSNVGAPRTDRDIEKFRRAVVRAAALPGLAIVESVDEPAWALRKPAHRMPPEALIRGYAIIKELAPNRLVYTNHAPTNLVSTLQRYNAGTDIVAVDIYPVIPRGLILRGSLFDDGLQGDLNNPYISQVGEYVRKMRQVAGPGRPVFSVQQGFAWAMLQPEEVRDEDDVLYPTRAELRFMAYQAVIESATGILYWGLYAMPKPSEHWDDVKSVVRELADLESVLAARSVALTPDVEYHELGHSVDDGLSILIKDVGDARYVLTCNADRYPCRATISGLGDWSRISTVPETRVLDVQNGTLTDQWPGFGVHLFRLER